MRLFIHILPPPVPQTRRPCLALDFHHRQNPGQPFMNYISVESIDDALAKVVAAGGTVALPRMEIGQGMGWIAAFKDTEGNILGFHQSPKKA